ncbi:MAG: S24/S26 family peptidase [Clostridiales bacterium]|nr:S24/S26 family peptidase [Clostridiales bacterium]
MINETLIEQYINENGEFIATPRGTSMWPMLRHCRDTVYLKKFDGDLKKYDIPLYKRDDGTLVLHRCIGKNADSTYSMCGDHQCQRETVREEQIIAVTEGFYRDERYVPCTNPVYKLYSRFWCMSLRLRGYMLRVLHKIFDLQKVINYPNK